EPLDLLQVKPVSLHDRLQTAESTGQTLGSGAGHRGDLQPRQEDSEADTGGELRCQIALFLQLHTALEQLANHRLIVLVLEERGYLVGYFRTDLRQEHQYFSQCSADTLQGTQSPGQQLGGFLADIGNPQRIDETRQAHLL